MNQPLKTQIAYLDGLRFERALFAGTNEVIANEDNINKINVFPIPDKDTGSNLKETIIPVITNFPLLEPNIGKCSQIIAESTVSTAMGYSGIIFSRFILGFAEGVKDKKNIYVDDFVKALKKGVERAYESLTDPVEGTVLTVFKEWSNEVAQLAPKIDDFYQLLKESYKVADSALQKTPEQLEVLRINKVVDAGGQAFLFFLDGILNFIQKGKIESPALPKRQVYLKEEKDMEKDQFCAECCVKKANLDRLGLYEKLNSIGEDLIFYGSLNFAKIHLRTSKPEDVFTCAAQFGELSAKKIFKFGPDLPSKEKKPLVLCSVIRLATYPKII